MMKGPAESLRGWVVCARGSSRQQLDLRDDSSPAMPHSTICYTTMSVRILCGKSRVFANAGLNTRHSYLLIHQCIIVYFSLNGDYCSVCRFSNMEKSRGQLTYMGALPIRRVPTISKLAKREPTYWQPPLCLHIGRVYFPPYCNFSCFLL